MIRYVMDVEWRKMNVRTVSKQLKVPWFLAMSWSAHWAHSYGPHRCLVAPRLGGRGMV